MAELPFSFIVYMYQSGIDRLERAFVSAIKQIEIEQDQARAKALAYINSGQDDSAYEYDGDDRILTRSTSHELDQDVLDITMSAQVIRDAFITATYHYWEKFAKSWTGKRTFPDLFEKTPYAKHLKLSALNMLNNHLKHGSDMARIEKLHGEWPELFATAPYIIPQNGKPHWRLNVRNDHVREAFDIVRSSGPQ